MQQLLEQYLVDESKLDAQDIKVLAKYASTNLHLPAATEFLQSVGAGTAARYLTTALSDSKSKDTAAELLLEFGPCDPVSRSLVPGLGDVRRRKGIITLLDILGDHPSAVRHVVRALSTKQEHFYQRQDYLSLRVDGAVEVLQNWGPTSTTIPQVVKTLDNTHAWFGASRVIDGWKEQYGMVKDLQRAFYERARRR